MKFARGAAYVPVPPASPRVVVAARREIADNSAVNTPAPPPSDLDLGDLTHDRLTRDVWLWQRKKGHRFSVDDVATAYVAVHACPAARTVLDLGCGIGSVLLHLAWSLPDATLVGIEAQAVSFALLDRKVRDSTLTTRVSVVHGDLRDPASLPAGAFDLVTGTPPYFPIAAALEAEDPQRAYARIEYRGGVEAYLATAARLLAPADQPASRIVLCGDYRAEHRVLAAAHVNALHIVSRTDVIARAPNPPLFSIWTLAREGPAWPARAVAGLPATFARAGVPCGPDGPDGAVETLTIRDHTGQRTPQAAALRAFSGL